MRLARALVHLVLAFAVLTAAVAQARAVTLDPMAAAHEAHAAAVAVAHAGHEHGAPAKEQPVHKREACQTVCCFAPGQLLGRAGEATAAEFSGAVRYRDLTQAMAGRTFSPDPGVPKRAA